MSPLFPTTLVGSYPYPECLLERSLRAMVEGARPLRAELA